MVLKNKNRSSSLVVVLGLCCLLWLVLGIRVTDAATVWSDNFNDGDTVGWTLHTGGFTASSNYLQGSTAGTNHISHASTVASGTWSFDLHIDPLYQGENTAVFFMASDLNAGNNDYPENGYSIEIGYGWIGLADTFALVRYENDVRNPMDAYTPPSSQANFHFDITRGDDDHIYVGIDGTLVMDRQNSVHDTSTHFFVFMTGTDRWIDNVLVSNTVDYDFQDGNGENGGVTPPPLPLELIAIAGAVVAVIVIVVIVFILRRRRSKP